MSEETKRPAEDSSPANEKKPCPTYKSTGLGRYLAILFAAAFLMLLLAYFMQLRTSEETLGSLKQSLTSMESLDELVKENQQLHDEIDRLEDSYDSLENELEQTKKELENKLTAAEQESGTRLQAIRSWEAVYQMDILYRNEDYEACAQQARTILNSNDLRIPEAARSRFEEIALSLQEMELLSDWEF